MILVRLQAQVEAVGARNVSDMPESIIGHVERQHRDRW